MGVGLTLRPTGPRDRVLYPEGSDRHDGKPSRARATSAGITGTAVNERLYIVTYDIVSRHRWRKVFRTMEGYGEWLQLSVFQCRLTARRRVEMVAALDTLIHHGDDHVLIVDLGARTGCHRGSRVWASVSMPLRASPSLSDEPVRRGAVMQGTLAAVVRALD